MDKIFEALATGALTYIGVLSLLVICYSVIGLVDLAFATKEEK